MFFLVLHDKMSCAGVGFHHAFSAGQLGLVEWLESAEKVV